VHVELLGRLDVFPTRVLDTAIVQPGREKTLRPSPSEGDASQPLHGIRAEVAGHCSGSTRATPRWASTWTSSVGVMKSLSLEMGPRRLNGVGGSMTTDGRTAARALTSPSTPVGTTRTRGAFAGVPECGSLTATSAWPST